MVNNNENNPLTNDNNENNTGNIPVSEVCVSLSSNLENNNTGKKNQTPDHPFYNDHNSNRAFAIDKANQRE